MKKLILLIIVVVFLAIVIAPHISTPSKKKAENPEQKKTLTGLAIAKQTFTFLDKTIKPEGGFYYSYECDSAFEQLCRPKGIYETGHAYYKPPPHFGHLTLAFYDYGKKAKDQLMVDKSDKAMEFILASCENDSDWCLWNFSPLITYYNETKDVRYKNAMLKVAPQLQKEKPLMDSLNLNSGLKFKALYDITGDTVYKNLLVKETDAILAGQIDTDEINPVLYKEGDFTVRAQTFKAIWSNVLPTYHVTKNEVYMKFAKDAFEKAKLTEHLGKLQNTNELQLLIFANDALLQLATVDTDGKEAYLAKAHDIAQYIYTAYADTPDNKKFNGDFGFVYGGLKDSLNNGWLVRHFIKLSDDIFQVN